MTDHFERTLATSLDERAASPVDTAGLATAAARRGRTLRRRRRYALAGAAGVVAVAVTSVAGVAVLGPGPGGAESIGAPPPAQTASTEPDPARSTPPPGGWRVPELPVAAGVPGAAADPDLVGADPGALHFSVDGLTTGAASVTWAAEPGSESITFDTGGTLFEVGLARDPARLDALIERHNVEPETSRSAEPEQRDATVGGLPATLYVYRVGPSEYSYLRWQPLPGVWAQVWGHGDASRVSDAVEVALRVRFDVAYRCVAPVRLSALPPNAKLLACRVELAGSDVPDNVGALSRLVGAVLTVGTGDDQADIDVVRRRGFVSAAEMTLGEHPAWKTRNERGEWLIVAADFDGVDIELAGRGSYDYPELTAIGEGIEIVDDPDNPVTWPTKPVD
ncbi:hypothetical protein O7626_10580 [Micromonospora sp. WMMD1102]|uniref:hypothetical protein n=1 Tax=Micromonospora sp. WMMD1102 TaxID=3016105 RepID=UPI00241524DC|nr:hypothetical protein [Micromonospora sp. WMMD1102]MDG4786368.1 hypothetical protein [Micromonospora sp. WMMD1102]